MKRPGVHAANRRRLLPTLALAAVAVLLVFAGVALARYVLHQQQDGLATATDFYFTSDYLKEESENAKYFIDPSTKEFNITLSNSADAERWTSEAIAYSASADGAGVVDAGNGKLAAGPRNASTLTVKPTKADSFTVTVKSKSPYVKTLTATFTLAKGNHYTVEDAANNTAAVLTITCADSGGPVALTLPAGVISDATDSRVTNENGVCKFSPGSTGVYSLVLLKTDKSLDLSRTRDFANEINLTASV